MADRLAELGKIMGDGIGKSARHLSFEEQWWLYEKCRSLQARVEELEAALAGDAGNVIYFAEQQALDRADEALRKALPWGEYQQAVDVLLALKEKPDAE